MEVWKKVNILYSFDSTNNVVDRFDFSQYDYYVSNMGRFKCKDKIIEIKPDSVGTKTYSLKGRRFKLHQIIMQTFYPEGIKNGYSVDHINRNRLDNRLENLRWADKRTQVENRDNSAEQSKKKVYCTNTGEHFNSCREAEAKYKLARNTVSRVARGGRHTVHGYNFIFE